jgi:hypothetical protein
MQAVPRLPVSLVFRFSVAPCAPAEKVLVAAVA